MFDLKTINSVLDQLEEERGIPRLKMFEAIESALATAYKKEYGKRGQIIRATFDINTGKTEFYQVKIVVDPEGVRMEDEEKENEEDERIRFNPEHHIFIEDASKIKKDAHIDDELTFPLELKGDFGRIAAQTAKQVIIQKIREAEKVSVLEEFGQRQGDIVNGSVQRIERGNIFVDFGRATGLLPYDEQIPGERYKQGERIRAYLYSVEESPRGVFLRLSRSYPAFLSKLFEMETPELAAGTVIIKEIAREAGSRSKVAVYSNDEHIDPVGSLVGQRGVRVSTVMSELGGEKIDVIEWSENPQQFIEDALSPASVLSVEIDEKAKRAIVEVTEDQQSLAIGKGGQNVRLAAKLTGWKIDIRSIKGENIAAADEEGVKIVEALLKHAIIQNASDIHIEPMENEMIVRYRIDGILHDAMTLPKSAMASVTARVKVLSNLKLDEKRLPQDGRFKVELYRERVSFRVSVLPTYFGEKIVMRLLKENVGGFTLEGLGFHGEALEKVHRGLKQTTGMILTTGPTGSGKTTTLYTMLDILNTPQVNISTIEDPIEYQMARLNQTQVKPEIDFTFASGLRSLVRQDPDIIMVGEIRDNETAALAINAALTGHLVFSTLHTNSASGAVPRLLDMGSEPFLLVSTLNVVIGQRLVRRLCSVKEEYHLTAAELRTLQKTVDLSRVLAALKDENIIAASATWSKIPFYKAKPSAECEDGYKGRVSIYEVFHVSSAIKALVIQGSTTEEIETQARQEGMLTMIEDGIFKAVQGMTTIEEVLRVVSE